MKRHKALLFVGPTGSGKTPCGDFLEVSGMGGGCSCHHFDFGENLRRVVTEGHPAVSEEDRTFLSGVLRGGALLENERFYLAEAILGAFLQERAMRDGDILILNGLPRHVDQAADVDALVDIARVVCFDCSPEAVCERIRINTGGDRTGRTDDDLTAITAKLALFRERTLPLLEYCRRRGVPVHTLSVGVSTQPADVQALLAKTMADVVHEGLSREGFP